MNIGKDSNTYFENHYLRLRAKEKRILSNEQLAKLPYLCEGPHANEWKLRAKSSDRFTNYLKKQENLCSIIEVGCGNGWFSHQISLYTSAKIVGIDINLNELEQAKTIFENEKTRFVPFDINKFEWLESKADMVVFNASIQYFENLSLVLMNVFKMLKPMGQIHIIDSPFYNAGNLAAAKKRSSEYFKMMDVQEMNNHYFHHSIQELEVFNPSYLYKPLKFPLNKIMKDSPFPWVKILKPNE